MDFNEAIDYVAQAKKRGIVPGLENMELLCSALGHPERQVKTVHIAGTNGKGSVGAFISSAARQAGLSVGRYASPAVFDYLEIIQLDGENISKQDFAACMTIVKKGAEGLPQGCAPTVFELETAAAFVYFAKKNCDLAVIECGMGGRLDATNVTDKALAVITSISLDHSAFLGDTVEKIAEEKAGIIRDCPVVSAPQKKSVEEILCKRSQDIFFADTGQIKNIRYLPGRTIFDYKDFKALEIRLCGSYQTENAALALEAALRLGIDPDSVRAGLKNALWWGRFDFLCTNPVVIADGAHNYDAALRLKESINIYIPQRSLFFVMGMLKDKEYKRVADLLAPLAQRVYTITPQNPRALRGSALAECIGKKAVCMDSVGEALCAAIRDARAAEDGAVLVFGSLSFLDEVYDFDFNMCL